MVDVEHTATELSPNKRQRIDCDQRTGTDAFSEQGVPNEPKEGGNLYMAVVSSTTNVGVAVYDESTSILHVSQLQDSADYTVTHAVKEQISPTHIIAPTRCNASLLAALKETDNGAADETPVELVKSKCFDVRQAEGSILNIRLPGMGSGNDLGERRRYLASVINLDESEMIRACGALLSYLQANHVVVIDTGDEGSGIMVTAIYNLILNQMVYVSRDSLESLQIFPPAARIGTKDELSLFSLFSARCTSAMGRTKMKSWMLRPLSDPNIIKHRQNCVAFFTKAEHVPLLEELGQRLASLKNVPRIMRNLLTFRFSLSDWMGLKQSLQTIKSVHEISKFFDTQVPFLKQFQDSYPPEMGHLLEMLNMLVDFEQSKAEKSLVIREGFDEELDKMKMIYEDLGKLLTDIAESHMEKLPEDCGVRSVRIIYFPQLGHVAVLDVGTDEAPELEGYKFMFRNDSEFVFKTAMTEELDENVGDIRGAIKDREDRVLCDAAVIIGECAPMLLNFADALAELDCYVAFSVLAKESQWVCPDIAEDQSLKIINGRHVLQELCVQTFVPNDTAMGRTGTDGILHIISGPNCSGKSVYLRQVGLIVYLAHLGSFVPAERATVGLVDKIFTRIHSREACSVNQSTFMIDLNQATQALKHCTDKSLILIDEFGKGTDLLDGVALFVATCRYLSRSVCPRTIAATNFEEVMNHNFIEEDGRVAFLSTTVIGLDKIPAQRDVPNVNDVVFLYKVKRGNEGNAAHGFLCAQMAHIPTKVLERAEEVRSQRKQLLPIVPTGAPTTVEFMQSMESLMTAFKAFDASDPTSLSNVRQELTRAWEAST